MLRFFKSLFPKGCHFCKGKQGPFTKYKVKGQDVKVCFKCVEYAERRAFPKS